MEMGKDSCIACLFVCICMILPRCYIKDFYVPALNAHFPSNATRSNTFIFFDLHFHYLMPVNSVRYGNLNFTLFYGNSTIPIANYTVPGFKQGDKGRDDWRDVVETHGLPWDDAIDTVSKGSKVVFRADLVADVKLKQLFRSKKKKMALEATFQVNDFGEKVYGKPIRLKSIVP